MNTTTLETMNSTNHRSSSSNMGSHAFLRKRIHSPFLSPQTALGKRDQGKRTASSMRDLAGHSAGTHSPGTGEASPCEGMGTPGGDGSQAWRVRCSVEVDQGIQGFRCGKRISESRNASKRH
jgi:hypothetical protein